VTPAIVYDSDCSFCRGQIDRIRRWAGEDVFEMVPRNTPSLLSRFPGLKPLEGVDGLKIVEDLGCFVGAEAVYRISKRIPRVSWLSWLYPLPFLKGFWEWAYGQVAKRRYKISQKCQDGTCKI
jgi:predicted DCC family thiol-disulfide oxidoreductase YuxK